MRTDVVFFRMMAFISRDSLPERSMTLTASYHGVFEWLHSGLNIEMKCSALLSIKQSKQSEEEEAEDAPRRGWTRTASRFSSGPVINSPTEIIQL